MGFPFELLPYPHPPPWPSDFDLQNSGLYSYPGADVVAHRPHERERVTFPLRPSLAKEEFLACRAARCRVSSPRDQHLGKVHRVPRMAAPPRFSKALGPCLYRLPATEFKNFDPSKRDRLTLLEKISQLTPTQFENFVYDCVRASGMTNLVWRTPGSDAGRDIEGQVTISDFVGVEKIEKWYIECKKFKNSIDWPTVWKNFPTLTAKAQIFFFWRRILILRLVAKKRYLLGIALTEGRRFGFGEDIHLRKFWRPNHRSE